MAIHTAVGFMILGLGYASVAWDMELASITSLPKWFPLNIGLAAITFTFVLWEALDVKERNMIAILGDEAANIADESVLVFGVLLSVILAISVYLMQRAQLKAAEATRANKLYRAEIKERKRLEEDLRLHSDQLDTIVKERTQELERRNSDLEVAMSEVKTLSGFLPICASCKKIRDDEGYWNQIESYISEKSEAVFSHGICPECAEKYYPGIKHDPSE
jgi:hypothetical protein